MAAGQWAAAADAFARSVADAPHFKALELQGECLLALGQARAAIVPLAAATALNGQGRAPTLLAEAFLALDEPDEALRFAQEALRRAPGQRRALAVQARVRASGDPRVER